MDDFILFCPNYQLSISLNFLHTSRRSLRMAVPGRSEDGADTTS
jgi:hypothetical protein